MSHSATDPFSAIYKARPGQLPSTLSIETYRQLHADHRQGKPLADHHHLASLHPSSPELPHEKYVFCPLLAGERDRVVRKRILSNPESLLPEPPPSTPKTSPLALAASASIHTHHYTTSQPGKDVTSPHQHHRSSTEPAPSSSSTNVDLSPYCNRPLPRGGIFFSPPRHSDAKRIRSELVGGSPYNTHNRTDHNSQAMMKRDSHARFSAAFSQAMVRGDACLDLDNQGLSTIPDICQLVEEQKTAIGEHEEAEKLVALISNMVEGGDRKDNSWQHRCGAMKRAQSAPPPAATTAGGTAAAAASLFLSNNYLTSSLFANLDQICYFQGLQHLSLRANQLSEIPPEIGNLRHLKVLNLAHNLLQFLPASILNLSACKLFLVGNPWIKPPPTSSPLGTSSGNLAASAARPVRQFRWLSQSRGVFYFSSPSARSLVPLDDVPLHSPVPSLLEACIRKMVITRDSDDAAEKIMGCDDGLLDLERDIQPPSTSTESGRPSSQGEACLLPARVQQIIADPAAYFYRCELCQTRLVLKPGSLAVGASNAQDPPPSPQHVFQFRSQNALFTSPPPSLAPTDNMNLDQTLIPIRWNVCTLNCCVKHLILI